MLILTKRTAQDHKNVKSEPNKINRIYVFIFFFTGEENQQTNAQTIKKKINSRDNQTKQRKGNKQTNKDM